MHFKTNFAKKISQYVMAYFVVFVTLTMVCCSSGPGLAVSHGEGQLSIEQARGHLENVREDWTSLHQRIMEPWKGRVSLH